MRLMIRAAAVLAFVVAAPAWAQETASFSIGSVDYTAPIPTGYCLPVSAEDKRRVEAVAAYDDQNLSVLSLVSCGPNANNLDSFVVKVAKSQVNRPAKLSDLLNGPEFAQSGVLAPVDDREMERIANRETGMDLAVESSIKILGHDDVCGYLGGTVAVSSVDKLYVTVAGCMTVVGDRLLMVIFSAPGNNPADITRLRRKARDFAVSIRARR
ncbi:MAG: hypothetical protein ACAH11_01905 [Sphingomonas sp.]